ncbi:protection of telomeres 1 L homeolog [Xenopus laevis]|uniref:Protection of telomeres protein 1 n=1 Tax=Xenopus laevis TaxID=8355 RepID=Q6XV81_XENLA|nr:protection of telomeres 1 L homeolog [Xenopus laevis]AAO34129.1 protection of telomeres 1 [Xenopus laevis]ACC76745.1 protection of telomeres 1 [Xenopus laevis]
MAAARAGARVSLQKYTYTPIDQLKEGKVFNVYGVVIFFKPPYRSKGTDYCLLVTIMDQSEAKLKCMLFSENQETLPIVYKVGEIVRFHRVKIQKFNDEIQGINSGGFSALVFDGIVGSPVSPRSTSKCYNFHPDDERFVEVLRQWASKHLKVSAPQIKISDVESVQFFDLLCQLVGKAEVDNSSYLIKVWDGTKISSPSWNVFVEEAALEGDQALIHQRQSLIIDVLVYDNHVESAKSLKIGSYLLIHNVHAKLHTSGKENEAKNPHMEFHLHGGTCFGRGITVLPESNSDVQGLQRLLVSVHESLDNIASQEIITTLHPQLALKAQQDWPITPLATVLKSKAPHKYRIRARLKSYEPQNLLQSVKLHCVKCNSLHDVPDEDTIKTVLQNNSDYDSVAGIQSTSWYQSAVWNTNNQQNRHIAIHFVKRHDILQNPEDTLIMLQGGTLQEIYKLSKHFDSIIPVKAIQGNLEIDISIPFLIQGNRWHYGCTRCSKIKSTEMLRSLSQEISWNATEIAKVLGIQPLSHVFTLHFTFVDETGKLNAFLWNYSEQFFHISASEILLDNKLQEKLFNIMDTLCPPRKIIDKSPWLDCCIKSYNTTNGGKRQICYEIFDTEVVEDDL